jgi:DNA repair protein RAD7
MDVDWEEKEDNKSTKKRKLSKAAEAKLKAKEKKKRGKKDSDDDEEEDAYTALSKSLRQNSTARPSIGSFENCSTCNKQFTVVKFLFCSSLSCILMISRRDTQ